MQTSGKNLAHRNHANAPAYFVEDSICAVALYARFAIRITGSDNPLFKGTSIFSTVAYPFSRNSFAPVNVAPIS